MFRLDCPTPAKRLAQYLSSDYSTVRKQLSELSLMGFVSRTRAGYTLTQGGSQFVLPLNANSTPGTPEKNVEGTCPSAYLTINTNTRMKSNPIPPHTLNNHINLHNHTHKTENQNRNQQQDLQHHTHKTENQNQIQHPHLQHNTDTTEQYNQQQDLHNTPSEYYTENLNTLSKYGISPTPIARSISSDPYITPSYINYHAIRLYNEHRLSTGLLLTCLKEHDPIPVSMNGDNPDKFKNDPYSFCYE